MVPLAEMAPAADPPTSQHDPEPPRRTWGPARIAAAVLLAFTVVFGAAVALGIVRTMVGLVGLSHPDTGWGYWSFNDAIQISLGHLPYEDPANGYSGLLYPPLNSAVVGALLKVRFWSGWGIVVPLLSGVALALMAASVAYRRADAEDPSGDPRAVRVVEAVAVGFVAFWLTQAIPIRAFYDSRPDGLAWALAVAGLLLTTRALRPGARGAFVATVLLLSAAFWTKQPAVTAGIAAGAWSLGAAALGVVAWRRAAAFVGALAVVNLLVLGALSLATHGWLWFFMVKLAPRHTWGVYPWHFIGERAARVLWAPTLFMVVAVVAGAIAYALRRDGGSDGAVVATPLREDPQVQRFSLLVVWLVVIVPIETYFQRKQGAESEHLLGIAWAIVMIGAVGYRWAGRAVLSRVAVGAAVLVLGLIGFTRGTDVEVGYGHVPRVSDKHVYVNVPADVLAAHAHGKTMLVRWGDMTIVDGEQAPSYIPSCELSAAAVASPALEQAVLTRKYDLVALFPETDSTYCSGYGKYEENYHWKLNRVIERGYRPVAPAGPAGLMERKPGGAAAAAALSRCFAPYAMAGTLWRIGHGGGFWCQDPSAANEITLGQTPAPYSEILTDGVVNDISGALSVTVPRGRGGVTILARRGDITTTLAQLPPSASGRPTTMTLRFAAGGGADPSVIDPRRVKGGRLVLAAGTGSHARFDLGGLEVSAEKGLTAGKASERR